MTRNRETEAEDNMKILQEETREPSSADHGKNVLYDIGETINIKTEDHHESMICNLLRIKCY